uniref:Serine protease DegS n=1 Tax=Candidatus Kentrum eta TaxID=2126337 RepID=A0A450V7D4_9GAMM|nr:MAG: serine protease DegS [Candidatus Kentron sp. H]VFJ94050.1 MAG: serine protease DegS [Candidatus Kentron sp. H]VFK00714.1 MAG: serine protease DegS [Candidatus Kentron sp. H]
MRLIQSTKLLYWVTTAGLAGAFVVVFLFPELLRNDAVLTFAENQAQSWRGTPVREASANPHSSMGIGVVSYADAVENASPAVVNIHTAKVVTRRVAPLLDHPFFRDFFGSDDPVLRHFFGDRSGRGSTRKRIETSLGSGVIVDRKGYILTNHHVIAGADEIKVMLQDGRSTQAKVVGTDPDTDLAVLRIKLDKLPAVVLGRSKALRVGDVVLAIGNPFGVGQTVTMGIVSATGRDRLGINTFEDFIQTDAAINPGNSGGALINPHGELIGINTAIFSKSGGSQGIGFAIPVSLARDVMEQIIEHGFVARSWLGIDAQDITPKLAESFRLKNTDGVLVAGVLRRGPADVAGMIPGDVITHVGKAPVKDAHDLLNIIARIRPESTAALRIVRDGRKKTIRAKVEQRPDTKQRRLRKLQ